MNDNIDIMPNHEKFTREETRDILVDATKNEFSDEHNRLFV